MYSLAPPWNIHIYRRNLDVLSLCIETATTKEVHVLDVGFFFKQDDGYLGCKCMSS
jgi:hypothetical protein